jgi:hypothetical protein
VLSFGLVSLFAEGARSIIGPYLATLGASAVVVGVAAGAGEFIGYGLRVVSGYLVQRSRRYWTWTIVGYALTVFSVPLIGMTHLLAPALVLYGTERLGKAVRSRPRTPCSRTPRPRPDEEPRSECTRPWTSSARWPGRCCWPQSCPCMPLTTRSRSVSSSCPAC